MSSYCKIHKEEYRTSLNPIGSWCQSCQQQRDKDRWAEEERLQQIRDDRFDEKWSDERDY